MNELIIDNSQVVFKVVVIYFLFFLVKKVLIFFLTNNVNQAKIENVSLTKVNNTGKTF